MQQLLTLLESAVDKYFTVFEDYVINNIIKVPENVAMPHWTVGRAALKESMAHRSSKIESPTRRSWLRKRNCESLWWQSTATCG